MAESQIPALIDKLDNFEIVRDQIAAILVIEIQSQMALAAASGSDPTPWHLRVFTERTNPIGDVVDQAEDAPRTLPLVNVLYHGQVFDRSASNPIERQRADSTFYLDCYTFAASEDDGPGHMPGDELARRQLHRVVRLVRNILMSGPWAYLGLRGVVGGRWISSIDINDPDPNAPAVQRIGAARITLQVSHNEFAPQVSGEPLQTLSVNVRRAPDGELEYFTATISTEPPP